jgi:phosphate transport system substrate-binding protein
MRQQVIRAVSVLVALVIVASALAVAAPTQAQTQPTATPPPQVTPTQRPRATPTPRPRATPTPRPQAATPTPAPAAPSAWAPRQLSGISLRGSGATFPNPLYQAWISVYKNVVPGVTISYQAVGSGQGQTDFVRYLTDFGGTDSVVPSERIRTEAPDTLHVPMVIGAVVPTYNLPGLPAGTVLRFSADTLSGIYLGEIRKWNDPRIVADNPGLALPDLDITVVYRSDSSGTTSIWTDYLSKVNERWRTTVGTGTTVRWPIGIGAPGNAGVAGAVVRTEGAIGYVEQAFAIGNRLPVPAVRNRAGNYVLPTPEGVSAAAAGVPIPDDLRYSITNPEGPNSYPIAGLTWILIREQTYTDVPKAQALTDFLYWALTEGQGAAVRLGYVQLPTELRIRAMRQLNKVRVSGQQVFTEPPR